MNTNFDKILFVISTDSLAPLIFKGHSQSDIGIVKQTARHEVKKILNGGNNYFIEADFSDTRLNETKYSFFNSLKNKGCSREIIDKIESIFILLSEVTGDAETSTYVIQSIASRLFWLHADDFTLAIPDKLINIINNLRFMDLDANTSTAEREEVDRIWYSSKSEWDVFLQQESMFDGITDTLCIYLFNILYFTTRLDFFIDWKAAMSHDQYIEVLTFISDEAHAELNNTNPDAAKLIDKVLQRATGQRPTGHP